jgi:hypothetical protein
MKKLHSLKALLFVCLLLTTANGLAQSKISLDLAAIRNIRTQINGLNVSCFYHFNNRLTGGIEMNRFFAVSRKVGDEEMKRSAWDFDMNFHYLLPLHKNIKLYPLTGISHTSEKEYIPASNESHYEKFWSFNTGAGLLCECGKWSPHIEYSYTWGHINQQFLLAGISYELEWGHDSEKHKPVHH